MHPKYAWLAGILDGEGCFTIFQVGRAGGGSGTTHAMCVAANITITNSSAAIMDECVRLLNAIDVKFKQINPNNSRNRRLARINVSNYQSILKLLDAVEPHLVGKAEQAALMRTFSERASVRRSMTIEERFEYRALMSQMNRTGNLIP